MVRLPVTIATSTGRPGYCFTCQPSRRATDSTRQGSALREAGLFRWLQQPTHLLEVSAQRRQEVPESASTKVVMMVVVRSAQQSDLVHAVIVMMVLIVGHQ